MLITNILYLFIETAHDMSLLPNFM